MRTRFVLVLGIAAVFGALCTRAFTAEGVDSNPLALVPAKLDQPRGDRQVAGGFR